jgi:hypothetical protein
MTAQLQLLEDVGYDEPLNYHDPERSGFVSILRQVGSTKKQTTFKLEELPFWIERLHGESDIWIGQCEFFLPFRRKVGLKRIPLCFIDLDTYKVPELQAKSPEALTHLLLAACDDLNVPPPSLVVSSGRGLQAKWLFCTPAHSGAMPRWARVQQCLQGRLATLGADPGALDCSRVLRLTGTTNSRSGEPVRVTHVTTTPTLGGELLASGVVGYGWDEFADTILPKTRAQIGDERAEWQAERAARDATRAVISKAQARQTPKAENSCLHALPTSQLAWDRLADLRTLIRLRSSDPAWVNGVPSGHRNTFMFSAACFLSHCCTLNELEAELYALRAEFASNWSKHELQSCVSSVMEKAKAAARGETIEFEGVQVTPNYRWKNQTLIERLAITAAEERQLQTIISGDEKRRRDTERKRVKRRHQGRPARAEWLASVAEKKALAVKMRADGMTMQSIATVIGVSLATVSNYLKVGP